MQRKLIWVVVLALAATGCRSLLPGDGGGEVVCTAIGCVNGVTVAVNGVGLDAEGGRLVAEACFDGTCERGRYNQQPNGASRTSNPQLQILVTADAVEVMLLLPEGDYDEDTVHDVTLELQVAGGDPIRVQQQVNLDGSQPNGPDCEPLCWGARIEHAV